jgi:hypothetical protein
VGFLQRLLGRSIAPEEPLLDLIREGGATFPRLIFTRNRRVMVSVARDRSAIRLHEQFREAPPEVLRALGRLYSSRSSRQREIARGVIRDFLDRSPPTPTRPRQRRRKDGDHELIARLTREFDRVNRDHFGARLPSIPIHLSGRMRRRNGHFCTDPLEIVISRRLCSEAVDGEAERTLRHEMIHLWQHERGKRPDHGADFRRWALILDIHPRATREVEWLDRC